jgi:hypothetical protein
MKILTIIFKKELIRVTFSRYLDIYLHTL